MPAQAYEQTPTELNDWQAQIGKWQWFEADALSMVWHIEHGNAEVNLVGQHISAKLYLKLGENRDVSSLIEATLKEPPTIVKEVGVTKRLWQIEAKVTLAGDDEPQKLKGIYSKIEFENGFRPDFIRGVETILLSNTYMTIGLMRTSD